MHDHQRRRRRRRRCGPRRPGSTRPVTDHVGRGSGERAHATSSEPAGAARAAARRRQRRGERDCVEEERSPGPRRDRVERRRDRSSRTCARTWRAGSVTTSATSGCTTTAPRTTPPGRSTRTPTPWARTWSSSATSTTRRPRQGKTTLAHELTHVVQQRSGPVDGTPAAGGIRVSDPSDRFEREAAATAERAVSAPAPVPVAASRPRRPCSARPSPRRRSRRPDLRAAPGRAEEEQDEPVQGVFATERRAARGGAPGRGAGVGRAIRRRSRRGRQR